MPTQETVHISNGKTNIAKEGGSVEELPIQGKFFIKCKFQISKVLNSENVYVTPLFIKTKHSFSSPDEGDYTILITLKYSIDKNESIILLSYS